MVDWKYISELDAFEIYEKVKEEKDSEVAAVALSLLPALKNGLTGAGGSAISNIVTYPLDLVVTRLQVQTKASSTDDPNRYDGVTDAVAKIYENEGGIPAFYAGAAHDTAKSAIDSFLFFVAYNLAWTLRKAQPPASNAIMQVVDGLGIGIAAGAFTKAITMPIQNVVTRKQTERAGANSSVAHIVDTIRADKGLAGFWSGYSASLVLTLNPAVTFFLDALWRRLLRLGSNPSPAMTFLLAASGKATASLLMYPFKMAKSRAQTQGKKKAAGGGEKDGDGADGDDDDAPPENVLMAIPYIARTEGVAALYAGVGGEVLKGFFTHGLTMLVKDRIQFLAIRLYYLFAAVLARQSKLKH